MNILTFVFIFLFGTIIGSFLNVVIYRFNTGRTLVKGRSICMSCNKKLYWYELIPIFSFLIQSGKCRKCADKISHQYPVVEFLTGLMFVVVSYHFLPILPFSILMYLYYVVFYALIFSILIVISVYDLRHKIIPDTLVYIFSFITFISLFLNFSPIGSLFILPSLNELLAGPILALPFAFIWLVSKGKWMGLGDAKLMLGIGWLLGLSLGLASIILSFWIGSIISILAIYITHRKVNMKTEIPFAPFLIVSTFIVFLFNIDIYSLSSLFQFLVY